MLKITVAESCSTKTVLKLEGRITHPWADLLRTECRRHLDLQQSVILDFRGVSGVDPRGARVIQNLCRAPVRIVNCPALLSDQLSVDERRWRNGTEDM